MNKFSQLSCNKTIPAHALEKPLKDNALSIVVDMQHKAARIAESYITYQLKRFIYINPVISSMYIDVERHTMVLTLYVTLKSDEEKLWLGANNAVCPTLKEDHLVYNMDTMLIKAYIIYHLVSSIMFNGKTLS